jgi:hypothetical protein
VNEFKTNIEMIAFVRAQLDDALPEIRSRVEKHYRNRNLIALHHSLGATIRDQFALWHPRHPVYKTWLAQGSDPDSPFHPDQYSMDVMAQACVLAFGSLPEPALID